jgi:hypothetical protein
MVHARAVEILLTEHESKERVNGTHWRQITHMVIIHRMICTSIVFNLGHDNTSFSIDTDAPANSVRCSLPNPKP